MTEHVDSSRTHPPPAVWMLGVLATLMCGGFLVVYGSIVIFTSGGACHDIPSLHDRLVGMAWLVGGVLLLTVPWVFAFRWTRFKLWVAVAGIFATAPGWYYVIYGLTPQHWATGAFCF